MCERIGLATGLFRASIESIRNILPEDLMASGQIVKHHVHVVEDADGLLGEQRITQLKPYSLRLTKYFIKPLIQ